MQDSELLDIWLDMALQRNDCEFWVYRLLDNALDVRGVGLDGIPYEQTYEDAPSSLIESGHVHPDSIATFTAFFAAMGDGRESDRASVRLRRRAHGDFAWCTLVYRIVNDGAGNALYAVGMRTSPRASSDDSSAFTPEFPFVLYPHLMRYGHANITEGTMQLYLRYDERNVRLIHEIPYDEALEMGAQTLFSSNEEAQFRELFSMERLTKRYRIGRRWTVARFRIVDSKTTVRPARIAVNVRGITDNGNLTAQVFVNVCDERTSWEADAEMSPARDGQTQIYTLDYAHLLITSMLETHPSDDICALVAVKFVGIERLPVSMRHDLKTTIGVFMNTDCVVYDVDESTVAAFMPSVPSAISIKSRMAHVFAAARASLLDADAHHAALLASVHAVATTVYGYNRAFDLNKAEQGVLSHVRARSESEPSDTSVDMVEDPVALRDVAEVRQALQAQVAEIPGIDGLSKDELIALSETLRAMMNAAEPAQAIDVALRAIGQYYRARRDYILMVPSDEDNISVLFEWMEPDVTSIQGLFANTPASRFPFITVNAQSDQPVLVSRDRTATFAPDGEQGRPWRFVLIPISHSRACTMMLCIDGPREHLDSLALASILGDRILHEWARLNRSAFDRVNQDEISPFYNDERDLELLLSRSNRGFWSSMGVLVVESTSITDLVEREGLRGAFEMFMSVRDVLNRSFEGRYIFHVSDEEFVVISPNQPYQAFIKDCARARTALLSAYPTGLQLGSSWTDSASNVLGTLAEARAIAERDGASRERQRHIVEPKRHGRTFADDDFEPIDIRQTIAERFTIYLQPKIDMRTGDLVGAEALARCVSPDGTITSPANAIQKLEQDGGISELDYYVFDAMLSVMSSWSQRGRRVVPISSNFSRSTLLGSTALASILAIMSRYPDVPASSVEMEITESAIDLGNSTLKDLVERYRSLGFRVALDDFGSHYSNVSVLANVPFDTIKLDRSLTGHMSDNEVSRLLVRNIADICERRGMECVAEGIETIDQARALVEEGCNFCQGFYYDRPMPVDLFERKYFSS